ncbi:hypothetical protein BY996DRAFT_8685369 [Phakopsora pachyrhizi]|nr:hypothetical protein BY996DRAFT_8685369 [Phakopsora pachyrhizi]
MALSIDTGDPNDLKSDDLQGVLDKFDVPYKKTGLRYDIFSKYVQLAKVETPRSLEIWAGVNSLKDELPDSRSGSRLLTARKYKPRVQKNETNANQHGFVYKPMSSQQHSTCQNSATMSTPHTLNGLSSYTNSLLSLQSAETSMSEESNNINSPKSSIQHQYYTRQNSSALSPLSANSQIVSYDPSGASKNCATTPLSKPTSGQISSCDPSKSSIQSAANVRPSGTNYRSISPESSTKFKRSKKKKDSPVANKPSQSTRKKRRPRALKVKANFPGFVYKSPIQHRYNTRQSPSASSLQSESGQIVSYDSSGPSNHCAITPSQNSRCNSSGSSVPSATNLLSSGTNNRSISPESSNFDTFFIMTCEANKPSQSTRKKRKPRAFGANSNEKDLPGFVYKSPIQHCYSTRQSSSALSPQPASSQIGSFDLSGPYKSPIQHQYYTRQNSSALSPLSANGQIVSYDPSGASENCATTPLSKPTSAPVANKPSQSTRKKRRPRALKVKANFPGFVYKSPIQHWYNTRQSPSASSLQSASGQIVSYDSSGPSNHCAITPSQNSRCNPSGSSVPSATNLLSSGTNNRSISPESSNFDTFFIMTCEANKPSQSTRKKHKPRAIRANFNEKDFPGFVYKSPIQHRYSTRQSSSALSPQPASSQLCNFDLPGPSNQCATTPLLYTTSGQISSRRIEAPEGDNSYLNKDQDFPSSTSTGCVGQPPLESVKRWRTLVTSRDLESSMPFLHETDCAGGESTCGVATKLLQGIERIAQGLPGHLTKGTTAEQREITPCW